MRRIRLVKGLLVLMTLCVSNASVNAEPIIWHGEPVNSGEKVLEGALTITVANRKAKGEIGGLSAVSKIDDSNQFVLAFSPKGTEQPGASAGTFKGYVTKDKELHGHWIRYGMTKRSSVPYASPVYFTQQGKRYQGSVEPLKDELTLFFVGEPKSENRYKFQVFIPETNYGRFYRNSEIILADGKASWVSVSDEGEREIDVGTYDKTADTFHLPVPLWSNGEGARFKKKAKDSRGLVAAKRTKAYQVPMQKNDGWHVGHAGKSGLDLTVLNDFADMLDSEPAKHPFEAQTEAVLIAHKGVLVFERYFRGYDGDQPHDLRSASKSLTGLLPGLAQQAGLLQEETVQSLLDTPVYKTLGFETDDPNKQNITLEHALSMSTGLDCNDFQQGSPGQEDAMQSQQDEPNWFRYILKLDAVHKPGSHSAYCSGGINLTGAVLTEKTQRWIPTLIEELFARPLGIKQYHVNLIPNMQQAYSGGGLHLTVRDFLKMGQLILNNGRWGNQQLLSPEYVESVITPRGSISGNGYGLGWWINTYEIDGHRYKTFGAGGNGGQQVFVVPELDMVFASLGSAYGTRGSSKMRSDWFPNVILKNAIKSSKNKQ